MNKIEIAKKVIEDQQYIKVTVQTSDNKNRKVILDLTTALYIERLYSKANDEVKALLEKLSWNKLLNMAFKSR